jgi:hypothetical protein
MSDVDSSINGTNLRNPAGKASNDAESSGSEDGIPSEGVFVPPAWAGSGFTDRSGPEDAGSTVDKTGGDSVAGVVF